MSRPVKLLIVDDSPFTRRTLARRLEAEGAIDVIGHASNGIEALDQVKRLRPDVVTMDVEMPRMDGLAALERLMIENPTPVVMLSSLTGEGTAETLRALELGAVDFFSQAFEGQSGRPGRGRHQPEGQDHQRRPIESGSARASSPVSGAGGARGDGQGPFARDVEGGRYRHVHGRPEGVDGAPSRTSD